MVCLPDAIRFVSVWKRSYSTVHAGRGDAKIDLVFR